MPALVHIHYCSTFCGPAHSSINSECRGINLKKKILYEMFMLIALCKEFSSRDIILIAKIIYMDRCPCKTNALFVLRFYGPVNPMGSCRARSVYLTTRVLGRLSPLGLTSIVHILSPETDNCPSWCKTNVWIMYTLHEGDRGIPPSKTRKLTMSKS